MDGYFRFMPEETEDQNILSRLGRLIEMIEKVQREIESVGKTQKKIDARLSIVEAKLGVR